jgi:Ca-activated chloride channel family protein
MGGITWREVSADLDEDSLREIAAITGGKSFRADDSAALRSVFQEIDRLEKRPIVEKRHLNVQDFYTPLLLAALLLVLALQALRATWLRGAC